MADLEMPEGNDNGVSPEMDLGDGAQPTTNAPEQQKRRASIDAKQQILQKVLEDMNCEGVVLLTPLHVSWFTSGMNVRGLHADTERPGVFTNGRQRWLLCSNVDSQRLFDEELDGYGFMLKEWQWSTGRATMLGDLVAGKRIASDRPFPGMPLINERLRSELRHLYPSDQVALRALGQIVVHALEATARTIRPGLTEMEVAGQLAHRVFHHGAEVHSLSISADQRTHKFRRGSLSSTPIQQTCCLQLTAVRDGLHVTASRMVSLGAPPQEIRQEYDHAAKVSAIYRSISVPGHTIIHGIDLSSGLLANTPYEHEWRLHQPCYGTGWMPLEELRKAGVNEKFTLQQALVWQARVGSASIVDTVLVREQAGVTITNIESWPLKRIHLQGQYYDIPDLLTLDG